MSDDRREVRNIAVVAHVDHGKSTLVDAFAAHAGLIDKARAGSVRFTAARDDERQRGITIKSAVLAVPWRGAVVNVVDTPGHIEFSAEVSAALRLADGVVLVVCAVEGVCVQTETVLRLALDEGCRVVLCVNKLDRLVGPGPLAAEPAAVHGIVSRIVAAVNALIAAHPSGAGHPRLDPAAGNVVLASGRNAWAVTPAVLAAAHKLDGVDVARVWARAPALLFAPLARLLRADSAAAVARSAAAVGVAPPPADTPVAEAAHSVMREWAPAHAALLDAVAAHLPSPREAQVRRVGALFDLLPSADGDAEAAEPRATHGAVEAAVAACDADGPAVVFVAKMLPADAASARGGAQGARFVAVARVLSGRVRAGTPLVAVGGAAAGTRAVVARVVALRGGCADATVADGAVAGDVAGLIGVESPALRGATLVAPELAGGGVARPLRALALAAPPVVRVAVRAKAQGDAAKLASALRRVAGADPGVEMETAAGGSGYVVVAAGEMHAEVVVNDAARIAGVEVVTAPPAVPLRECVRGASSHAYTVRSRNRHNTMVLVARPCSHATAEALEAAGSARFAREVARSGSVVVVDSSHGIDHSADVRAALTVAVAEFAQRGVLCGERLRGVRFDLVDAQLHADPTHRNAPTLVALARSAMAAAFLAADPGVDEPHYRAHVVVAGGCGAAALGELSRRKARVESDTGGDGTDGCRREIVATLPVAASLGLVTALRAACGGRASATLAFARWAPVAGDLSDAASPLRLAIAAARARNGVRDGVADGAVPALLDFVERTDVRAARRAEAACGGELRPVELPGVGAPAARAGGGSDEDSVGPPSDA